MEQDLDEMNIEIIRNTLYKVGRTNILIFLIPPPPPAPHHNCGLLLMHVAVHVAF